MKILKLLFALVPCFCFSSCLQPYEERTEQDFSTEFHYQAGIASEIVMANPTKVYLFEDNGKTIDTEASIVSVRQDGKLTYTDSSTASYKFTSGVTTGRNVFADIPNGNYILWAYYTFYPETLPGAQYMSTSIGVAVNDEISGRNLLKTFKGTTPGYQPWNAGF